MRKMDDLQSRQVISKVTKNHQKQHLPRVAGVHRKADNLQGFMAACVFTSRPAPKKPCWPGSLPGHLSNG